MPEPKIARTVAEAQVGDLLWQANPERNRYDAGGKYIGRGTWSLVEVSDVGRLSVIVGRRQLTKYDRQTGEMRGGRGVSSQPYIRGSAEREHDWWHGQRYAIAKMVQERDTGIDTLRTIAFALGMDAPPDFSVVPAPSDQRGT